MACENFLGRPSESCLTIPTMPCSYPGVGPAEDQCDASYHIHSILNELNELRDLDGGLRPAKVKGYSGKALSYSLILCIEDHTTFFWATLSVFK